MRNYLKPVFSVAVLGLLAASATAANANTPASYAGDHAVQPGHVAASHAVIGQGHSAYRLADGTMGKQKFPDSAFDRRKKFPDSAFDHRKKFPDSAFDRRKKFPDSAFDHGKKFPDSAFDKGKKFPDSAFDYNKKAPKTGPNH